MALEIITSPKNFYCKKKELNFVRFARSKNKVYALQTSYDFPIYNNEKDIRGFVVNGLLANSQLS